MVDLGDNPRYPMYTHGRLKQSALMTNITSKVATLSYYDKDYQFNHKNQPNQRLNNVLRMIIIWQRFQTTRAQAV